MCIKDRVVHWTAHYKNEWILLGTSYGDYTEHGVTMSNTKPQTKRSEHTRKTCPFELKPSPSISHPKRKQNDSLHHLVFILPPCPRLVLSRAIHQPVSPAASHPHRLHPLLPLPLPSRDLLLSGESGALIHYVQERKEGRDGAAGEWRLYVERKYDRRMARDTVYKIMYLCAYNKPRSPIAQNKSIAFIIEGHTIMSRSFCIYICRCFLCCCAICFTHVAKFGLLT